MRLIYEGWKNEESSYFYNLMNDWGQGRILRKSIDEVKKLFSTFTKGNTDDSYFNKNKFECVILKLSSFRSLFNNDFLPTMNSNSFILDIFNIPKNCFSVDLRINAQIIASYLKSQWTINVATLFENKFIFSLIFANKFFNKYLN